MRRSRLVGLLAVLLVLGIAGVASGSQGEPLIAGQLNRERKMTAIINNHGGEGLYVYASGIALQGTTTFDGFGVRGLATHYGVGVFAGANGRGTTALEADNPGGAALAVESGYSAFGGRVTFAGSGISWVRAGSASVIVSVSPDVLTSGTGVVATLQRARPGVHVAAAQADRATSTVIIKLNRPVDRDTPVAWFLFD